MWFQFILFIYELFHEIFTMGIFEVVTLFWFHFCSLPHSFLLGKDFDCLCFVGTPPPLSGGFGLGYFHAYRVRPVLTRLNTYFHRVGVWIVNLSPINYFENGFYRFVVYPIIDKLWTQYVKKILVHTDL